MAIPVLPPIAKSTRLAVSANVNDATVYVDDTTGFPSVGLIHIEESKKSTIVQYSGKTANSFTGCEWELFAPALPTYLTEVRGRTMRRIVQECRPVADVATDLQADWNQTDDAEADFIQNKPVIPTEPTWYKGSGFQTTPTKVWMDTVTPSTGNGFSINISSAGFTTILGVSVIAVENTSTATSVPIVVVKSISPTAIVVNLVSGNPQTQTILGILVLGGAPVIFTDVSGVTLRVAVWGI